MNITEFLEARIAEDEAAGHDASPGPWTFSDIESVGGGTIYDPTVAIAHVEWDTEPVDRRIRRTRPSRQADATGIHIARHDPARILAECAAKRAIIEIHHPHDHGGTHGDAVFCDECQWDHGDDSPRIDNQPVENFGANPCRTLLALAAVYKEHPDYDPAWSPNAR